MTVKHTDFDLLEVPRIVGGDGPWLLVQGCNCKGVWGRGIALAFRNKFPEAYQDYQEHSYAMGEDKLRGTARIYRYEDGPHKGVWTVALYTSTTYAPPDNPAQIVNATDLALNDFKEQLGSACDEAQIYSNKFNSGLFHVPWGTTELFVEDHFRGGNWTVCTPQGM